MEAHKQQEAKLDDLDVEAQQSEQQMTGKNKANLNERLISSTKKGQYEEVEKCLKKKADINYEENNKKKWTALIWACCLGNYRIVKLLISKGAANPYLEVKPENRAVVLGATKEMKPNPLHWACFKDHLDIFYVLIKTGLHWQDIDNCGNNSVMLSAAGNAVGIFKAFLQYGVDINAFNSRGHTVKDLTTNPEILELAAKYHRTKQCAISGQVFKEKQTKHWCPVCGNFVSQEHFKLEWVLSDLKAVQKQKIDGRCKKCWAQAQKIKTELQKAIQVYDEQGLKKCLDKYKKRQNEIQIKFLQRCWTIHHKLHVQNEILSYIKSLSKVENYKVILKSVNKIKQMLKNAEPVNIDANVIEIAHKQIERLNAERNLRYEIDNIDTSVATREGVAKLQQVFSDAETKSVSTQYLEVADQIKGKMSKSILAQDLCQLFKDYPLRADPYPPPMKIDFKSKKPIDPQTGKPTDPVNLLPKKKKGKKAQAFNIPQWAMELAQMNGKIKECQQLLVMREQLGLSQEFCAECQGKIDLMKKESRYRKDMDELQRMVDETNKKKK